MTPATRTTSGTRTGRAVLILFAWAVVACAGDAQEIALQNASGAPAKVTASDISTMPHQKVSVDEQGKTVTFQGVPLRLLLEKAGVTFGDSLRGKRLSSSLTPCSPALSPRPRFFGAGGV